MGSGASLEQEQKELNKPAQNNIFIDEGVGIEQSQLSRKWTTKMTMFKNLETKNFMESQFQNKSPRQSLKLEQKSSIVFSDDSDQISKSSSPSIKSKSSKMHNTHQKKKTSFQSDSDEEESDIEEKQLHNDRRQTKFQNFNSDDSLEDRDEATKIIKQRIYETEETLNSRKSSINSRNDQQFLAELELNEIHEEIHLEKQPLPHKYPLSNLYLGTIISEQKLQPGKDKLVKMACRQCMYDSEINESINKDNNDEQKSEHQPDYQPETLLNIIGLAVTSKKGNKNDATPLASDYCIYNDNYQKIIILCNGHGEFGEKISNLTYRMVFHYLIRTPTFYTAPLRGLETIFKKLQNKLKIYIEKKKLDDTHNLLLSGCVITVIVQRESKLYCAQIGDNRAYIYKEHIHNSKQKKIIAQILPVHTPIENAEKARIFNSGGEVRKNVQGEEYVFVRGRLYPQLHVTRSLGDVIAHVIGVSSQPFFLEYDITYQDTFLILSTSPVFAYQDENDIMNHLSGFSLNDIKQACESLYKYDYYIIMAWLIKRAKMNKLNLRKPRALSPLKKITSIKNFQYLCDNDQIDQSLLFQEQKFGSRSPQKLQEQLLIKSNSPNNNEIPQLLEILPKSQVLIQKYILTDSYAVILTFKTFSIKFENFIRQLDLDETVQLCYLDSIESINQFCQNNIVINSNSHIDINIGKQQNLFQKYQLPQNSIFLEYDKGIIEIQYPTLTGYFQDSSQYQIIQITNSDVIHLIGNKFQTIQQYCQRINFGKQRTFIRQYHELRIKEVGIDIYDQSTFKQIQIRPSKSLIDLNQKCLKQVCEMDQQYVIIKLQPPQLLLKQLKKTIHTQILTLSQFMSLCLILQKIQLETFLMMIKLKKINNKYEFQLNMNEYTQSNEISTACLRNGLLNRINKSISYDLNCFKIEYIPFKIVLYDQIEVKETEMPSDFNLIEQMLLHRLNVEFAIF